MFNTLSLIVGAIAAFALSVAVATIFYGPIKYAQGAREKAAELDALYSQAAGELFNEANQAQFERLVCVRRGGVYDFAKNKCHEAKTD